MELFAPILAFLVAALACRTLTLPIPRRWFLDKPNDRSLHVKPVPRTGGMGILLGVVVATCVLDFRVISVLLALSLMLAIVSLFDDWKGLSAGSRLMVHLFGALALTVLKGWAALTFASALIVISIVWMINLYNFMDGADGLAGGMGVFGFGAYATAAWYGGDIQLALLCASISAAAAGFLLFNFPPAKMFMGDVGSVPLGFLAASIGAVGWKAGLWPFWFPFIVFAPFIVDASVTLGKRALRGERIWQAHRSHYYQRQVLLGWTHRQLALAEYVLMGMSVATGLIALRLDVGDAYLILAGLALLYVGLMIAIDRRWARREMVNA